MTSEAPSIGFMQGRLTELYENKIQSFPWNNWEKEFELANKNGLKIMEWTIDSENLFKIKLEAAYCYIYFYVKISFFIV